MDGIQPIRNSVHVCSLNTSSIKRIAEQAVERAEDGDIDVALRLRWLSVAMECNRQHQMRILFTSLGNKGKSPKFRQVRMGPFWHQWKREALRSDWSLIREKVDKHIMDIDFSQEKRYFESQRVELAARSFMNLREVNDLPIDDLVTSRPVEAVYSFSTPGSNMPGYYNKGYNYVETAELSSMSDISDDETIDDELEPWDVPLEEKFKEKAVERHFNNVTFTQDSYSNEASARKTHQVKYRPGYK